MRNLTDHQTNAFNDKLAITVLDEPGAGGANHVYAITGYKVGSADSGCHIQFQNGPIAEAGINGISQEALLAVVIDRLRSFQKGDYSCRENSIALTKIEEALHWLQSRTRERVARGVEGTSAV